MGRSETPVTNAEVGGAIDDLRVRVAALEQRLQAPSHTHVVRDAGFVDALIELTKPAAGQDGPAGSVAYAGVAQFGADRLAWQMIHDVQSLLALDDVRLARQLAAVASPVRLRILRELAGGPLPASELHERLNEPSAGQLYHHLRELLAAGLVTQPRRSVYEVPDRVVVPLLALIACASDLATDALDGVREEEG